MEGTQPPQIELPKPVESGELVGDSGKQPEAERIASVAPQNVPTPPPVIPVAEPVNVTANPSQNGSTGPDIADDVDVIEKEWVQKARAIVQQTKQDPYKQNKELTVFKADYMKKRYGKDVKLTSD